MSRKKWLQKELEKEYEKERKERSKAADKESKKLTEILSEDFRAPGCMKGKRARDIRKYKTHVINLATLLYKMFRKTDVTKEFSLRIALDAVKFLWRYEKYSESDIEKLLKKL